MKHYRFVDWATQGYTAFVGLLILVFHGGAVPHWGLLMAAHGVVLALVHGLVVYEGRAPRGSVVRFLRAYYPILLYTGFYRETGLINGMFISAYVDPLFMRWDQILFGCQPSLVFMERFPQRWWSEVMYGCYFSYYFMIAGVGLALWFRNRRQFAHFVTIVSVAFYCCYLTYVVLPVMGPRIFYADGEFIHVAYPGLTYPVWGFADGTPPPFPESVQEGWFYQIVIFLYTYFESEGAAFPSSHVALALVTLYFSWIYLPRIRWLHVIMAVGLCTGTVYCRYHYVVDVFAGIAVAVIVVPLANRVYRRFEGSTPPS